MLERELENEKKVLERAIEGESSAFGLLYDKYQPKIFRFIFLKVSHREEAEDLTHQVFLSAWQNIKRFKDEGLPLSSWLYAIARNRVIDFYRTRKFNQSLDEFPEQFLALANDDSQEELIKKIDLEAVYLALKKLPPDYQEVIILRFIEDLSPLETAQAMGRNQGAIRILQHRALKHLKKIVKNND